MIPYTSIYAQDNPPTTDTNECSIENIQDPVQQNFAKKAKCKMEMKDGVCTCVAGGTAYDLSNASTAEFLSLILRLIFVIMWPLMAIGGYAMDNAMVYGEVFHMDIALYQFWNLMKNLANYFLAFYFIRNILKGLRGGNEITAIIKNLLKSTLIAAIGIQLSWWIVGMLLDLSTILTYGVGAMPLNVLKGNEVINTPILSTHTSYKLSDIANTEDKTEDTLIYYSYGAENYIQCSFAYRTITNTNNTQNSVGKIWTFAPIQDAQGIIGRNTYFDQQVKAIKAGFAEAQSTMSAVPNKIQDANFVSGYCVDNGKLLKYHEPDKQISIEGKGSIYPDLQDIDVYQKAYKDATAYLNTMRAQTPPDQCGSDLSKCKTLSELIKAGQGMTGPLYALYGSILNIGNLAISTDNKTVYSLTLEFMIKAVFSILLFVPLVFICVMLVARALLMWLVIVFSPWIVIFYAFGQLPGQKQIDSQVGGMFSKGIFGGVLSLIFMPVVAVMTISLGLAAMQIMSHMSIQAPQDRLDGFGISKVGSCHSMSGIFTICSNPNSTGDNGFSMFINNFNWFIISMVSVAVMRFVMMTILKSIGILSDMIDTTIDLGTKLLKSAPIIPLPSGATSLEGLKGGINKVVDDRQQKIHEINREASDDFLRKMGYKDKKITTQDQGLSENTKNMPSYSEKMKTSPRNETIKTTTNDILKSPTSDYVRQDNMHQALTKMGANIGDVIDEMKGSKEGEQKLKQLAQGYKRFTDTEIASDQTSGLVDAEALKKGLSDIGFRTKLAEQMYNSGSSTKSINTVRDHLSTSDPKGNDAGSKGKESFWSQKVEALQKEYTDRKKDAREQGQEPILVGDIGNRRYLYRKHEANQIRLIDTSIDGDKIKSIENTYVFANADNIGEFNKNSKIVIHNPSDLSNINSMVQDLKSQNIAITDELFGENKLLYPLRDYQDVLTKLEKQATTVSCANKNYEVNYKDNTFKLIS